MGALLSQLQASFFVPPHLNDSLEGKIFVVTGGLAGIGLHTTLHLALRGATVLAGARSPARALPALATLETSNPSIKGRVVFFECELSSFDAAKEAAERVKALTTRLDGLVNNAGRLSSAGDFEIGENGVEMLVQVNHFGTALLTKELLPLLRKTALEPNSDVRIITVASNAGMMLPSSFRFVSSSTFNNTHASSTSQLNSFTSKFKRYAASKVYNILWTKSLQEELDKEGAEILCVCLHPGGVATEKLLELPSPLPTLIKALYLTPSAGAWTSLFALTSPTLSPANKAERKKMSGAYLEPYGRVRAGDPKGCVKDDEGRKRFWDVTEKALKVGKVEF
ncbi:NAD(P)-binding protein [Meredithblackwellia eburnea MCA 4105]